MSRYAIPLLVLCGSIGPVGPAFAGWVAIKNETNQPIVVQESCVVNNQLRRGEPLRLMPGEALRGVRSCPGTMAVQILECGGQKRTMCEGELTWDKDDYQVVVRNDGRAARLDSTTIAAASAVSKASPTQP